MHLEISTQRLFLLAFMIASLVPVLTHAQDTVFIADSTIDAVYRGVDLDNSQSLDPSEWNIFYDDSASGPDLSTPTHLLIFGDLLLLADGGTHDSIFALIDNNSDGDANDAGEISVFYDDSAIGPNLSSPNGMVATETGQLFVVDDGSGVRAIFSLQDFNADNDALDDGEITLFYDETGVIPITDPESIAISGDGQTIFIGDSSNGQIVALRDLNADGDAFDSAEAWVFATTTLTDIDSMQVLSSGALLIVDEDSGDVMHALDTDGDGAATDGELQLWFDSAGSPISDANDSLLISDDRLLVVDGANDAIYLLQDQDGSGDIDIATELNAYFDDGSVMLSTPSAIAFLPAPPTANPPLITAVQPTRGSTLGGQSLTLIGSGFESATSVEIGGSAATSFEIIDDQNIVVILPSASSEQMVSIQVFAASGQAQLIDAYEYRRPFIRGDANRNSIMDISDAILAINYISGMFSPPCLDAIDSNNDGIIDIADPTFLLGYMFQLGTEPPAPFPLTEIDDSGDFLGCEF